MTEKGAADAQIEFKIWEGEGGSVSIQSIVKGKTKLQLMCIAEYILLTTEKHHVSTRRIMKDIKLCLKVLSMKQKAGLQHTLMDSERMI